MTVRVLLFGHYRDYAPNPGSGALTVTVSENATVTDVAQALATHDPRLADLLVRTRVAVGGDFAAPDTLLHADDEIAFLPPMSGG